MGPDPTQSHQASVQNLQKTLHCLDVVLQLINQVQIPVSAAAEVLEAEAMLTSMRAQVQEQMRDLVIEEELRRRQASSKPENEQDV